MSCLICAGPAERIHTIREWEERKCAQCGHYRMSDALVRALMDQGQIFDVAKARAWLAAQQQSAPLMATAYGLLVE
ncbi:hypothetical protein ACIPL1_21945 [Pseudomonas sp. NPDC090202]|uniref:hypothetical protein n=1 Tax=unclassified Pseudomonas TaxID=196821 RepID=UPI00380DD618